MKPKGKTKGQRRTWFGVNRILPSTVVKLSSSRELFLTCLRLALRGAASRAASW